MQPFIFDALPTRVVFGSGTLSQLKAEATRLGTTRALILTTPNQATTGMQVGEALGDLFGAVFSGAVMHTPTHVTEEALVALRQTGADLVVSIGGGSTIGLGKALALRTGVNQLVIPTTYAGSEMTPILGQTDDGLKTTVRNLAVLPETVIYDVDLTMSLPTALSATSGINAIAHAVEALYAKDRNPIISMIAEEGIRSLATSLPSIRAKSYDQDARKRALYGAWLCGYCLGSVGMALHHKLCHTLGGSFGLPHSETHTVILPHAVAYNSQAAPEAMSAISRAIGASDAANGLYDLISGLGADQALSLIGMPEDGIERAADIAVASPYWNPRPIEREALRDLIARAYVGKRPSL
ncbi:maleylacetate reductase [Tardiphaga alba]|uniref:Maleylacetate reductase n=1 Tax=Tardiphaga alba TaxID=340268 RepID=A0ABX8A8A6_9BRAD|nr:maleylacetate reductase [Tardiphaga alba]QUS38045.1 maleylacetate reductase [Tardiphaga alba]